MRNDIDFEKRFIFIEFAGYRGLILDEQA